MKNICIIANIDNPHIQRRVKFLIQQGNNIIVVSSYPSDFNMCKVYYFPISNPKKFGSTLKRLWAYYKLIKSLPYDLLHIFFALDPFGWIGMLATSKPVFISTMGSDVYLEEQQPISFATKICTLKAFNNAQMVGTLNPAMKKQLIGLGISKEKIIIERWSIEPFWLNKNNFPKFDNSGNFPIIISPRMLKPFYNIHLIVEAFVEVRKAFPKAQLHLSEFGVDINYKNQIIKIIQDNDLEDSVRFLGQGLKRENLPRIFGAGHLAVMMPPSDGTPMTLLESIASGLLVLVADIPHYNYEYLNQSVYKCKINHFILAESIIKIFHKDLKILEKERLINYQSLINYLSLDGNIYESFVPSLKENASFFNRLIQFFLFFLFLIEPWLITIKKRT